MPGATTAPIVAPDKARDVAVASGDRDDRSAGRVDPVEFARHDQAFGLRPQRNQINVGNTESSLLIGEDAKQMVEAPVAHSGPELAKFLAATDREK
jgi:hypothetical protein